MTKSPWFWLVIAGICEVVYALAMPHTRSFTRFLPSVFTVLFIGLSMYFLSVAMRSLPVGTAYAVWVGIGAGGTAFAGLLFLNESKDVWRLVGVALIIAGILLLKLTHKEEAEQVGTKQLATRLQSEGNDNLRTDAEESSQ